MSELNVTYGDSYRKNLADKPLRALNVSGVSRDFGLGGRQHRQNRRKSIAAMKVVKLLSSAHLLAGYLKRGVY